ncbi:MAG: alpha-galactosidase, partial [Spirochaetales bacterium]|nr:alpha-galactosidase [Spirochaetales bacterium]
SLADVCYLGCSQGKVLYKYTLGVYDFLQRLLDRYPNLLIEGCSGGGGRFDAGMLYYTPQIWTSDNTDAIERTLIQYGTSFAYPISSMGSHVSAVPNHQTGRKTPLNTRSVVAMAGSFGYELDLNKLSVEEKDEVKKQTDSFKELNEVIHNGLYYRLTDPTVNKEFVSWLNCAEDKKEALLSIVTLSTQGNPLNKYVRLKGLEENINYYNSFDKKVYKGSSLMHGGILLPYESGEYNAYQMHFKAVN